MNSLQGISSWVPSLQDSSNQQHRVWLLSTHRGIQCLLRIFCIRIDRCYLGRCREGMGLGAGQGQRSSAQLGKLCMRRRHYKSRGGRY